MARLMGVEPRAGSTDRGQLLLLTAVGIASLLVVLALLLNTVIFTENVATRQSSTTDVGDALGFQHAAVQETRAAIATENSGTGTAADMKTNVTSHLGNWSALAAEYAALDARHTSVRVASITYSANASQTDATSDLSNSTGAPDWTLVEGADAIRTFTMTVTPSSLIDVNGNDANQSVLDAQGVFAVTFDGTTKVHIYRNGSVVTVRKTTGPTDAGTVCHDPNGGVIDFVSMTFNGTQCPALDVLPLSNSTIAIENGDAAVGTYSLLVDGNAADPMVTSRITNVTIDVSYASKGLTYGKTVTVPAGASP